MYNIYSILKMRKIIVCTLLISSGHNEKFYVCNKDELSDEYSFVGEREKALTNKQVEIGKRLCYFL